MHSAVNTAAAAAAAAATSTNMKRGVDPPGDTSKRLRYADPFSSAVLLPSMSTNTAWVGSLPSATVASSVNGIAVEPVDLTTAPPSMSGGPLSNSNNNNNINNNINNNSNNSISMGLGGLNLSASMMNNDDVKARQLENIFNDGGRYSAQDPANISLRRPSQPTHMSPVASTLSASSSPFISVHAMDHAGMSPSRYMPTSPANLSFGGVWSPSAASLTAVAANANVSQGAFSQNNYGFGHNGHQADDMYATLPRTPIMSPASTATPLPYDTPMSPMSPLSPAFPVTILPFPAPQSVAMDSSKTNSNGGSQRVPLPSTPMSGSITPNQSPMRQPCRTIYLGGLPSNADARDILEQIRAHGVIESIRMLPERGCAFVSFLSAAAASAFHNDYAGSNANGNHGANNSANGNGNNGSGPALTRRSLVVSGQEIKVSWGKPSPVPLHVLRAAEEDGATRTVFISSLVLEDTEPRVRDACEQFGEVETLRWFPDRRIAFAHFTSIADAIRCVAWFRSATDQWFGRHVGYGRDRCVLVNGTLQPDGPSTGLSQLDRMDLGRGAVSQQAHQQLAHQQQQQQQAQQQQRVQQQMIQQHQQAMMSMNVQGMPSNNNQNNNNNSNSNSNSTMMYPPNAVAAMAYAAATRNRTDSFGNIIPSDIQLPPVINHMSYNASSQPQSPVQLPSSQMQNHLPITSIGTPANSMLANMNTAAMNANGRSMVLSPELTATTLEQQQQGSNSALSAMSWIQPTSITANANINGSNANLFMQTPQPVSAPQSIQSAVCSPPLNPQSILADPMTATSNNNGNGTATANGSGTILSNPGSPTAMMMLDQPMVPPSPDHRTVYLGNLKRSTTVEDLCNVIRGGALERIRLIPEKRIAFVSFITADSAADFYRRALHPGLVVKHQRLRPGWGRPRPLPSEVMRAVSVGASRNVYLGGLDDARVFTVERLRDDFAEYGEIELVNTLPERQCAFVNFTSVAAAVKAVDAIRGKPGYERVRVNFGKDRCANPPRPELDANTGSVGSPGMSPAMLPTGENWPNLSDEALYQSPLPSVVNGDQPQLALTSSPNMSNGLNASLTMMFENGAADKSQHQHHHYHQHQYSNVEVDPSCEPPQSPPATLSASSLSSQWMTEALFSAQTSTQSEMKSADTAAMSQSQLEIFPPLDTCLLQNPMEVSLFSWGSRGPRSVAVGAERQGSSNELLHSDLVISAPSSTGGAVTATATDAITVVNPWKRQSSLESRLAGRLW